MPIKEQMEEIVGGARSFRMGPMALAIWPSIETLPSVAGAIPILRHHLGTEYAKLSHAIIRNAFLIELVRVPKIETTKFRVRWVDELKDDPRYCSFEECLEIAVELLVTLPTWLERPSHAECMRLCFSNSIIPYEAPMDYVKRLTEQKRLHQLGNLTWLYDELVLRTLKLRKYVTDTATSPDPEFFRSVLTDKIGVKTYLTDRVLTGEHKTNREKRWETHPESVHFAERRVCLAIEYALVTQVCAFQGFPQASLAQLQRAGILPADLPVALCPITGDALSYEAFRSELLNPTHGKSEFHVGHLNPLKLGAAGQAAGHGPDNISWLSADGNRIQGNLSLDDVRKLIKRISENYAKHGWMPQD